MSRAVGVLRDGVGSVGGGDGVGSAGKSGDESKDGRKIGKVRSGAGNIVGGEID